MKKLLMNPSIALFTLVFLAAIALQAGANGSGEALETVIDEVLKGKSDEVWVYVTQSPLEAGFTVRGWDTEYVVPARSWFFFIDDFPGANWHHPCRYVLVDCIAGTATVIEEKNPPHFFESMMWIIGKPEEKPVREDVTVNCPPRDPDPIQGEHLWAVLCAGYYSGWDYRYWNDLSHMYTCLVEEYGYPDDHIYVLFDRGSHSKGNDLDRDGDNDINYSCTQVNMDYVFGHLADTLTEEDQLFMFVTDHGGSNGGWNVYINLYDGGGYTPDELDYWMDRTAAANKIFCMEQCYSGGFGPTMMTTNGDNRVLAAACMYNEYSWKCDYEGDFDEFVYYWTSAVRYCFPQSSANPWLCGADCDADGNGDGLISMTEAFDYAEAHDSCSETPQYYESTPGIGDQMWLGPIEVIPDISVTAIPDETTVPRGGTLGVTVTIKNNTSGYKLFEAWCEVHPLATNPVAGPKNLNLAPSDSVSKHLNHHVPMGAPLQTYTYTAIAGYYPGTVLSEGSFDFNIVASD